MKALSVLLVLLSIASVTGHQLGQRNSNFSSFIQFLRRLMAMYQQSQQHRPAGGPAGGQTGIPEPEPQAAIPCDLSDYVCVPRGTCESQSDVQIGATCANPNYDCCDM